MGFINMENKALCTDIYKEEINTSIKSLNNFKEAWNGHTLKPKNELFKYADDDFYFYRFAIDREEKNTIPLLNKILCKAMNRYHINFEVLNDKKTERCMDNPFDFIINTKFERIGYRFIDFYDDENTDLLLNKYNLDKACIILTKKGNENSDEIKRKYGYRDYRKNISFITIQSFFDKYFSNEEYNEFESYINEYISQARNILGYKSIKIMSKMNLATRKLFEEKILLNWNYESSKYQIIDSDNQEIQNKEYVEDYNLNEYWKQIIDNYINNKIFKAMLGTEDFAESFITSEWLYYSIKGEGHFDYTAIVSGYLKSIEQLLKKLVMINIDNNCVISINDTNETIDKILKNNIIVYEIKKDKNTQKYTVKKIAKTGWNKYLRYPYIDFIESQKDYMGNSIGAFEHFFKNNPQIFIDSKLSDVICDMVSCFRIECRNGHFHTHNLNNWNTVIKIRENAILLYALLLGSIKASTDNKSSLGIIEEDNFDKMCKEIRDFRRSKPEFIFVYENGIEKKMLYDTINNTIQITDDGLEHYESLIFYEVENFSTETYEKLNTPIKEEWKRLLTRDNLPKRIYCYDTNKNIHEVSPDLLK